MNDDVEEFYTDSISHESRCTSFEVVFRAVRRGGFRHSFGIGFVRIVVLNLSGYFLYQFYIKMLR